MDSLRDVSGCMSQVTSEADMSPLFIACTLSFLNRLAPPLSTHLLEARRAFLVNVSATNVLWYLLCTSDNLQSYCLSCSFTWTSTGPFKFNMSRRDPKLSSLNLLYVSGLPCLSKWPNDPPYPQP